MQQQFTFASFTFPRFAGMLPQGSFAKRVGTMRNPICGPYILHPKPRTPGEVSWSFYLDSDFMPGLRWQWCDEVATRIRHSGWFIDDHLDTIRGLVMRLPHGRGFLAGWSMGEQMASELDGYVWKSEIDAAWAADQMAERAAEREREYREEHGLDSY